MNKQSGTVAVIIGVLTATIPTFLLFQAVTFLFIVPLVLGILCIGLGVVSIRNEGRLLRHVGWFAVIIMLIAVVLPFGMIAYNSRSGYPIVMVIPDGYRGPVRLIINNQEGVEVPLENGKYTYHIPESGTLLIKDDSPFRQWISMTTVYSNGKPIPMDNGGTLPPDAVSLHSLGSWVKMQGEKKEESIENFVGTKAERIAYVNNK